MDIVSSKTRHVSCDGEAESSLGHPKVYLEIKPGVDRVECPYCGKTFVYAPEEE